MTFLDTGPYPALKMRNLVKFFSFTVICNFSRNFQMRQDSDCLVAQMSNIQQRILESEPTESFWNSSDESSTP